MPNVRLGQFFKDVVNGGANVLYITDSRGALNRGDSFISGVVKWDVRQWNRFTFAQCANLGSNSPGYSLNQNAGLYTNTPRAIPTNPTALPVFNNGDTGFAIGAAGDYIFTSNAADGTQLIINELQQTNFLNTTFCDGKQVDMKYVYYNGTALNQVNFNLQTYRNGSLQTTLPVNAAAEGVGVQSKTVSCGNGTGLSRISVFSFNGETENTKTITQLFVQAILTGTVGTGFTMVGNPSWRAFDWTIGAGRFTEPDITANLNALGPFTHLVVDLGQNLSAAEQADIFGVFKTNLQTVINEFIARHPTITKVLLVGQYDTGTWSADPTLQSNRADAQQQIAASNSNYSFFDMYRNAVNVTEAAALGYLNNVAGDNFVHPTLSGSIYYMGLLFNAGKSALNTKKAYNTLMLTEIGTLSEKDN